MVSTLVTAVIPPGTNPLKAEGMLRRHRKSIKVGARGSCGCVCEVEETIPSRFGRHSAANNLCCNFLFLFRFAVAL